jgi:hypothetical protein
MIDIGRQKRIRFTETKESLRKRNNYLATLCFVVAVLGPGLFAAFVAPYHWRGMLMLACVIGVGFVFVLVGRRLNPESTIGWTFFKIYSIYFAYVVGFGVRVLFF